MGSGRRRGRCTEKKGEKDQLNEKREFSHAHVFVWLFPAIRTYALLFGFFPVVLLFVQLGFSQPRLEVVFVLGVDLQPFFNGSSRFLHAEVGREGEREREGGRGRERERV